MTLTSVLVLAAVLGPQAGKAPRAEVQLFVMADCPIAQKFSPEVKRIVHDFGSKGVSFTVIHVDPHTDERGAEQFSKDFGLKLPHKLDSNHQLAKKAGVTTVPSVAVFAKGSLRYKGRIDDRFPDLGIQRQPRRHDLRIALQEVLAGKKVTVPETKAIGCSLPTLL
jgi:hypothetical protein